LQTQSANGQATWLWSILYKILKIAFQILYAVMVE